MKIDIPEGASQSQMPRYGEGRILSNPALKETYKTFVRNGVRYFKVRGKYRGKRFSERSWKQPFTGSIEMSAAKAEEAKRIRQREDAAHWRRKEYEQRYRRQWMYMDGAA